MLKISSTVEGSKLPHVLKKRSEDKLSLSLICIFHFGAISPLRETGLCLIAS